MNKQTKTFLLLETPCGGWGCDVEIFANTKGTTFIFCRDGGSRIRAKNGLSGGGPGFMKSANVIYL